MDSLLVLTFANKPNQFLEEWESSVQRQNLNYKIIGSGLEWKGFITKTLAIKDELENLNDNLIVIIVDSYDVLFLQGQDKILEKYNRITPDHKILLGSEPNCINNFCIPTCIVDNININISKRPYLNGGFIMGPVGKLKKAYKYVVDFENDQLGWSYYTKENCNEIVLDLESEIVLNYFYYYTSLKFLSTVKHPEIILTSDGIYNISNDNYPSVIHMPAQMTNPLARSEYVRNYMFPNRNKMSEMEYFKSSLNHVKLDTVSFSFICIFLFLVIIFIYFKFLRKKINFLYYILIILFILFLSMYIWASIGRIDGTF